MKKSASTERQVNGRGLAIWLIDRWRNRKVLGRFGSQSSKPRMELVERIALGPRQSLSLVEADGRRFLIATSGENGPVLFALEGQKPTSAMRPVRTSWS